MWSTKENGPEHPRGFGMHGIHITHNDFPPFSLPSATAWGHPNVWIMLKPSFFFLFRFPLPVDQQSPVSLIPPMAVSTSDSPSRVPSAERCPLLPLAEKRPGRERALLQKKTESERGEAYFTFITPLSQISFTWACRGWEDQIDEDRDTERELTCMVIILFPLTSAFSFP